MAERSRSSVAVPSLVLLAVAATAVAAAVPAVAAELQPAPQRLVLCMDGTWNNPAKEKERDDGDLVYKPTNVLKTCRAVAAIDDAAATLVLTGRPTDGETVTVDGKTYTFQERLTDGDGHVQIGDSPQRSLENLRFAIDRRRHRGRYADATTRHPTVTARPVAGNRFAMEIVPRRDPEAAGADGDPFAVSETLAAGYWADKAAIAAEIRARGRDPLDGIPQVAYYDIGVGALREYPGLANRVHRVVDNLFGGAAGAGFEGNVEDAYTFLSLNYRPGDEIYLFGFSRGAAEARALARFLDWMGGVLPPGDAYWVPRYFDAFLAGERFDATRSAILAERIERRIRRGQSPEEARREAERVVGTVRPARIRFLGVWDTVLALGGSRERPLIGDTPPAAVDHARQALAIDERRSTFRPRIWRGKAPANPDQTLEQRWFAGVHTNIGGGYVNDGLANLALEWMLDGARDAGLGLDWGFVRRYGGFPQDQLYDSSRGFWRFLQTITFRRDAGVRPIEESEAAGLSIHPTVFHRLAADPDQHDKLDPYRPENLFEYLARHPDLDAYLDTVPGLPDDFELPAEVVREIGKY